MSDGEKPSKESLREVKREFKERRRADEQRAKDAQAYWDQQSGRAPQRGGRTALVVGLTALALVAAGGGAAALAKVGPFAPSDAGSGTVAAPAPTPSASPSATSASPSTAATSASPAPAAPVAFAGSPAARWKPGFTGLVAPRAAQVGIYRTAQVKAAYAMTLSYLGKALLDPRVNFKGEMAQVLKTLGPGFPAYAKKQHAIWVRSKGAKGFGYVNLANRFHPGDWVLVAPSRASGRVGKAVIKGGFLRVPFVFTSAYWLRPAKGGEPRAIAIRRSGYLQFEGYGPRNVWLRQWYSHYISSASVCGAEWKQIDYLEAWPDTDAVASTASAAPSSSFDLSDPDAPEPGECFTDTSGF